MGDKTVHCNILYTIAYASKIFYDWEMFIVNIYYNSSKEKKKTCKTKSNPKAFIFTIILRTFFLSPGIALLV